MSIQLIPELLREAQLTFVEHDTTIGRSTVCYRALRRSRDGTALDDDVELSFLDVSASAVSFDTIRPTTRPSSLVIPTELEPDVLEPWPFVGHEVETTLDCANAREDLDLAPILHCVSGNKGGLLEAPHLLGVHMGRLPFSHPAADLGLWIGFEKIAIAVNGVPLTIETWEKQYAAWWNAWSDHWDDDSPVDAMEASIIPAGDITVDKKYVPPQLPAFAIEDSDVPEQLLQPIRDFHEGTLSRDWERVAGSYPNLNESLDERARSLDEQHMGQWGYIRSVDSWWREKRRACIVVRGVEHSMPCEGEPAENKESVWEYALRMGRTSWVIHTWSQGWPDHGSAGVMPSSRKPWLTDFA